MVPGTRFKVRDIAPHDWRTLGDQFVVFDSCSGDTHVLDAVVREVLACLDVQPLAELDLIETMATRLNLDRDDALDVYIAQLLSKLDDLGLVEAVAP